MASKYTDSVRSATGYIVSCRSLLREREKEKIIDAVKLNEPGGHHQSSNDDNLISLTLSVAIKSPGDVCCPRTIQYTRVDGLVTSRSSGHGRKRRTSPPFSFRYFPSNYFSHQTRSSLTFLWSPRSFLFPLEYVQHVEVRQT